MTLLRGSLLARDAMAKQKQYIMQSHSHHIGGGLVVDWGIILTLLGTHIQQSTITVILGMLCVVVWETIVGA